MCGWESADGYVPTELCWPGCGDGVVMTEGTDQMPEKPGTNETPREPSGILVLRTLAMPRDTNPRGDIFGGWIMSQMDIAGGLMTAEVAQGRTVTVTVDKVIFRHPVTVGDTICVHAALVKVGRTSMDVLLEVWARDLMGSYEAERQLVAEALFRFVAIDPSGAPRVIPDNPKFFTRP